ncbi:hypothetical protein EMIT0P176_140103 [Pseudomonas sp. IT-P176]
MGAGSPAIGPAPPASAAPDTALSLASRKRAPQAGTSSHMEQMSGISRSASNGPFQGRTE